MKKLIILTGCLLLAASSFASAQGVLRVRVTGLQGTKGQLRVALFKTAAGFPDQPDRAAVTRSVPPAAPLPTVIIDSVAPGAYAVAVLHDANSDGKMNYSRLGPPLEGYGVSNNIISRWGPPQFSQAVVTIADTTAEITIRLNY